MTRSEKDRIAQAVARIEGYIAIVAAQGVPLPILGLELAASDLRQIGGAA
ncbi:hypothetical protein LO749_10255 [Paracoccus denitrificans]|nr:hypothetical protein [Paracoccus denitrificans]UFS64540.1 hypothetical protein LO749_10255 [Paracoccus denitrificans]